jgi:inner membrane protein COX18
MKKLEPLVSKRVLEEMKRSNIRGDKKLLRKYHDHKCIQLVSLLFSNFKVMYEFTMKYRQLTMQRKELLKQYKCSPFPSIIAPILSQLPFFVGFTVVLSRLSVVPTPFDSESFFTLSTLAHPDPTMTLPVILGFLTMANVESGNWVLNAAEREQVRKAEEEDRKRILESGKLQLHPGKILKTSLRGLSIVRIIIAAMTPGVRFSSCFVSIMKYLTELCRV